jgi:hypothetical protein
MANLLKIAAIAMLVVLASCHVNGVVRQNKNAPLPYNSFVTYSGNYAYVGVRGKALIWVDLETGAAYRVHPDSSKLQPIGNGGAK